MFSWIQEHRALLYLLTAASFVLFLAPLIVVPALIVLIPAGIPAARFPRQGPLREIASVCRSIGGGVE
jgi:hypothetical protein